jgi:hypothetical protein
LVSEPGRSAGGSASGLRSPAVSSPGILTG